MIRPLIVITDYDLGKPDAEVALLRSRLGAEVRVAHCRTESEVIDAAADADGLLVQWAPITARVIEALNRCRAISRYGIGLDMIDLEAARAHAIEVANVPHYCTEEVATHAVSMLLALWRRLPRLDASVRAGHWEATSVMEGVPRLSEATLGLLGAGRIAHLVARAFTAFGTRIVAHDPYANPIDGVEYVDVDELATADLISLHAPLTGATRHVVNKDFLTRMPKHGVLVNTARGGLIDHSALIDALRSGSIAAAGLDVFESEPLDADDELTTVDNLLLAPHAAWCSNRALPTLKLQAAENLIRLLRETAPEGGR